MNIIMGEAFNKGIDKIYMKYNKGRMILLWVCGMIASFVLSIVIYSNVVTWRINNPEGIYQEVGYRIPENAQIIKIEAHLFSLVDGSNFNWLIASESSLRQ